ncbi:hypothetical protein ACHAWF_011207 [Thalassiosira exigua]
MLILPQSREIAPRTAISIDAQLVASHPQSSSCQPARRPGKRQRSGCDHRQAKGRKQEIAPARAGDCSLSSHRDPAGLPFRLLLGERTPVALRVAPADDRPMKRRRRAIFSMGSKRPNRSSGGTPPPSASEDIAHRTRLRRQRSVASSKDCAIVRPGDVEERPNLAAPGRRLPSSPPSAVSSRRKRSLALGRIVRRTGAGRTVGRFERSHVAIATASAASEGAG